MAEPLYMCEEQSTRDILLTRILRVVNSIYAGHAVYWNRKHKVEGVDRPAEDRLVVQT